MSDTFKARGNWGTLTCSAVSGLVLDYDRANSDWEKEGDGYENITRLDAMEWRTAYPGEVLENGQWDVLDFGSWDVSGHYEPAPEDWRKEIRNAKARR